MVQIDPVVLLTAISALFSFLVTGSTAVIKHLVSENRSLREDRDKLMTETLTMVKAAVAALDKMGGR